MKSSTANLIKVNLKNSNNELACQLALLGNVEGGNMVYLPNAYDAVKEFISPQQWAGHLSALQTKGFYKRVDGEFGMIEAL